MNAIYLVRYRMKGAKAIHLYVTFAQSLPAALNAFHSFMANNGAEHFQYEHLSHREIPEIDFAWGVHQQFLEKLPRDELIEFLECRAERQMRERETIDDQTSQLLEHFKVTI